MVDGTASTSHDRSGRVPRIIVLAAVLNGAAFVVVNFWIYYARAWFIETHREVYFEPPTISRAITPEFIGQVFSVWITLSAVCLSVGVSLLVLHYVRIARALPDTGSDLRRLFGLTACGIAPLQVLSGVGMVVLSRYRGAEFSEMHMMGSYMFFVSQALINALYFNLNRALLRAPVELAALERDGLLRRFWVRVRYVLSLIAIALTLAYLGLFLAKDVWSFDQAPQLHLIYALTEPALISTFLFVLLTAHVDKLRRR
ncbi:hypothetical protein [Candidatus Rhodobacter oscarellae]|uniref:hypothetical protein n=1 Tax=Candidatus Rhodobacter oscarellae TaxID=1675527 RepID=UPI000AD87C66|nr:hypothetical protein [Candidatus Rhodobacter lobularis]